ncbi:uncharacterized protein LOC110177919 [Drosophila serrata]|uniref:uncharacterized protein LOC110177919 n=1 Tax=Drosophila serrata TaxID=7274 RepID=UPI000A1D0190|nr:uncharacterized protein LOC110177919 [Drosophila serrata]
MMRFMLENPDVARGFAKGDRVVIAEKWQKLHQELNSAGPPTKHLQAWKKIWVNRQNSIRAKLAKDPFGDKLSSSEKAVASICELHISKQEVNRSRRIKTVLKKEPQDKKPFVKKEPLSEDEKENHLNETEDTKFPLPGFSAYFSTQHGSLPLTSDSNLEIGKILQTIVSQQAEHYRKIEAIEEKKLEVTKKISENFAKLVNK